jgi:hypothetical protein
MYLWVGLNIIALLSDLGLDLAESGVSGALAFASTGS